MEEIWVIAVANEPSTGLDVQPSIWLNTFRSAQEAFEAILAEDLQMREDCIAEGENVPDTDVEILNKYETTWFVSNGLRETFWTIQKLNQGFTFQVKHGIMIVP